MRKISKDELLDATNPAGIGNRERIVLTGARNSGKSQAGREFAELYGGIFAGDDAHSQLSAVCDTVAEEIALGLETRAQNRQELLHAVDTVADELGIRDLLERNPLALSGGQTQLTVLASYLAMKPAVLVLDEPLIGLDASARANVLRCIATYPGTVLWTTSRPSSAAKEVATVWVECGGDMAGDDSGTGDLSLLAPKSAREVQAVGLGLHPQPVRKKRSQGISWRGATHAQSSIVEPLNFTMKPGEILALTGANGSGKTTLLRTVAGLIPPHAGAVSVGGEAPSSLASEQRVHLVSLAAQKPAYSFIAASVAGELKLGGAAIADTALTEVLLGAMGLAQKKEMHPHDLSLTEQHLLTLVIALCARPSCLLLDEPTARVDERAVTQIARLISAYAHNGGAVMVASHDQSFLGRLKYRELTMTTRGAPGDL